MSKNNETMREVSHTNPYTGESMGSVFEHGVTIVADGGRDPEREDVEDEDELTGTEMKDVDHTPPHDDGEGTDRTFARGGERVGEETEE
ncbi:hypothetical protein [Haloarchaeobius amylolyticus]|uniref:hypothetical protein n=1 Tax=Haloarchaeobius amylolyticus TaxID=1198296 RepID=UPI0022708C77|nr:hypothetical protein [Haloarchaeobius amylolyticus]